MGVLGICRSSFNNWAYQGILISDRKKDPKGRYDRYALDEILKGVIVQKLRKTRMDLAVAVEISLAAVRTEREAPLFWYNIETKEYGGCWHREEFPMLGLFITMDLDELYEEVKERIIAWEDRDK